MKFWISILVLIKPKYKDIDEMPIYNFNKVMETGNLFYLCKSTTWKKPKYYVVTEKLNNIWESLVNQDMSLNGVDDRAKEIIKKKKELAKMILKYIEKDKSLILNEINIIENQLADLQNGSNKQDENLSFEEVCGYISKSFAFEINPRTTTVLTYKKYCKIIEKEQKELEKINLKNHG